MKMRNIFFGVLLVLVISIAGGLYFVYSSMDSLIGAAIEKYGSEVTKTNVRVHNVEILLQEGGGAIAGLSVANPGGFSDPNIFELGEISTRIDVETVTEDPVVIDEIRILGPEIFYEINQAGKTNLNVLKENIAVSSTKQDSQDKQEKDQQETQSDQTDNKFVIRRLVVESGHIKATIMPLEGKVEELVLPPIELKNIGGQSGADANELARQIIGQLLEHTIKTLAASEINKYLGAELQQGLGEGLSKTLNETLGSSGKEMGDNIKGLFSD